jgi:hypothetical protein
LVKRGFDWLFRSREDGRIVVAQWPNLSLVVFGICEIVEQLAHPGGVARGLVDWIGRAALAWWSIDEIVRGVNPFRRVLGVVVLARVVLGVVAPRYVVG